MSFVPPTRGLVQQKILRIEISKSSDWRSACCVPAGTMIWNIVTNTNWACSNAVQLGGLDLVKPERKARYISLLIDEKISHAARSGNHVRRARFIELTFWSIRKDRFRVPATINKMPIRFATRSQVVILHFFVQRRVRSSSAVRIVS